MFSDISRARFECIFIDVLYPTVKNTLTGQLTYLPVRGHPLILKNMQMKKEIS